MFSSNVQFTETEPSQPHRLPMFLAPEGLKAGVPDMVLPLPHMKHSGDKLSAVTQLFKEPLLHPSHAMMGHQYLQPTLPSPAACSYPMQKSTARARMAQSFRPR